MKNGQTPIHIQRWAPADFHGDEHVKLLKARRDYRTLTFYRHFLDQSFIAGGSLPADLEALAAVVEMPRKDVETALVFCLNRLIFPDGDRLYQNRIRRDIAAELGFRAEQSERGKLGGRPRKEATALDEDKPPVFTPKSPPAPAPAPAPFASASADAKRQPALPPAEASASPTAPPTRSLEPEERDRFWTAVWTAWCTKRGGNGREPDGVEFALARRWLDSGVPLRIVLQGLEDCSSKNLTPSKRLTYVGPAVDEEIDRWRRSSTS